jgi:hypothetical protein
VVIYFDGTRRDLVQALVHRLSAIYTQGNAWRNDLANDPD